MKHGECNTGELEAMTTYGFTELEAIQAATSTASRVIGELEFIGTIEEGRQADLVVVDGNLLEDIRSYRTERRDKLVMKGGQILNTRIGKNPPASVSARQPART